MIDLFTILKNKNCINGIDISELIDLLVNKNTTTYDISMVGKGKIILKNKEDNKFEKLDCICSYFDTEDLTDCNDIKEQIIKDSRCPSCKECFTCALKKLEAGEISLK